MKPIDLARAARKAARALAVASGHRKTAALHSIADRLVVSEAALIEANARDLAALPADASSAFKDRLTLNAKRIGAMAEGVRTVAGLTDPVGEIRDGWTLPNGLKVEKISVPIGVVLVIYESRPNVTADAAALTLKSGNAVILRGGKEAFHSNQAIASVIAEGLRSAGLPPEAALFVETTEREYVKELLSLEGRIDVAIPRGGEGLIRMVVDNARVPVIYHGAGICHTFVDRTADSEMAAKIVQNAKCSRPGVCNAMETLLVHRDCAPAMLPVLAKALDKVELRGCDETRRILPQAKPATEEDWKAEYLDLILAVRVVGSVEGAVEHIEKFGSHLADAIVTRDIASADYFAANVDSAAVYVNTSTRFTDGGEYGLGAEIGISTQKLHARGPMGVRELTTTKYVVRGQGQVRA